MILNRQAEGFILFVTRNMLVLSDFLTSWSILCCSEGNFVTCEKSSSPSRWGKWSDNLKRGKYFNITVLRLLGYPYSSNNFLTNKLLKFHKFCSVLKGGVEANEPGVVRVSRGNAWYNSKDNSDQTIQTQPLGYWAAAAGARSINNTDQETA